LGGFLFYIILVNLYPNFLPMKNSTDSLFRLYKYPLLLAVFSFVIFFQTSFFSFTYFDDDAVLIRNQNFLETEASALQVLTLDAEFQKQSIELYRPTQNLSFFLETSLFRFNPSIFHSFNWILHIFVVLLLYFLLIEFEIEPFFSFFLSSLFVGHPLIAFAVSWLPARGDLLLAFFTLISLISYFKYLNFKKGFYLFFHFLGFVLALFSKESALMIIPLIVLFHIVYKKNIQEKYSYLLLVSGYIFSMIVYFAMHADAVAAPVSNQFEISNGFKNIGTIPETIFYLFFPFKIPVLPFYNTVVTTLGVVLIGLISFIYFKKGLKLYQSFGLFWFLFFLGPGMLYAPQWSSYIYDYLLHRTYLPLIGLLIFIGVTFNLYLIQQPKKWVYRVLFGLVFVLSLLSLSFSRNFANALSFWQYAVETNPTSAFANAYLGNALMLENKYSRALTSYDKALILRPDFDDAYRNRAKVQLLLKNYECAKDDLKVLNIKFPTDSLVRFQLTEAFYGLKQYAAVIDLYKDSPLASLPTNVVYQIGMSNLMLKAYEAAHINFSYLIQKQPDEISIMRVYAVSCSMTLRDKAALEVNENIYSKDSNDFTSMVNLGYALWQVEAYGQAKELFQKAHALNSHNVDAILGLMLTYYKIGELNRVLQLNQKLSVEMPSWSSSPNKIDLLLEQGYLFTPKQAEVIMRF